MTMKKRILTIMLALALILSVAPLTIAADDPLTFTSTWSYEDEELGNVEVRQVFTVTDAKLSDETIARRSYDEDNKPYYAEVEVYYVLDGAILTLVEGDMLYINGFGDLRGDGNAELSPPIVLYGRDYDFEKYGGYYEDYTIIGDMEIDRTILESWGTYNLETYCIIGGTLFKFVDDLTAPSPEPPPPPPPPDPLDGAANWAKEELGLALDAKLLIEDMFGKWPEDTSRLLAADAIVRLIEVSTGKSIDAIAAEKEFDMGDTFADTDSKAATFLKASGISNGVDGVNYGYSGTFTRAQLVTMLGRMAENVFDMDLSDYPQGSETFSDIPASMGWAEQYIGWAAALDITQGDGGADKFNPGGNLTNQQTGLFTYRAFDLVFGK